MHDKRAESARSRPRAATERKRAPGSPLRGGRAPQNSSRSGRTYTPSPRRKLSLRHFPRSSSPARRARCATPRAVAGGKAFLLQAGDCAESFDERYRPTRSATS